MMTTMMTSDGCSDVRGPNVFDLQCLPGVFLGTMLAQAAQRHSPSSLYPSLLYLCMVSSERKSVLVLPPA
jgi:hypothetical protein